jgi:hypothetical protein
MAASGKFFVINSFGCWNPEINSEFLDLRSLSIQDLT